MVVGDDGPSAPHFLLPDDLREVLVSVACSLGILAAFCTDLEDVHGK